MEINKLNVGQICSVKIFIKSKCYDYEYRKERRFLGFVTQKEGFYNTWNFRYDIIVPKEDSTKLYTLDNYNINKK